MVIPLNSERFEDDLFGCDSMSYQVVEGDKLL